MTAMLADDKENYLIYVRDKEDKLLRNCKVSTD
jgi:hypothetical protein